jgi:hypothetical protein
MKLAAEHIVQSWLKRQEISVLCLGRGTNSHLSSVKVFWCSAVLKDMLKQYKKSGRDLSISHIFHFSIQ